MQDGEPRLRIEDGGTTLPHGSGQGESWTRRCAEDQIVVGLTGLVGDLWVEEAYLVSMTVHCAIVRVIIEGGDTRLEFGAVERLPRVGESDGEQV